MFLYYYLNCCNTRRLTYFYTWVTVVNSSYDVKSRLLITLCYKLSLLVLLLNGRLSKNTPYIPWKIPAESLLIFIINMTQMNEICRLQSVVNEQK